MQRDGTLLDILLTVRFKLEEGRSYVPQQSSCRLYQLNFDCEWDMDTLVKLRAAGFPVLLQLISAKFPARITLEWLDPETMMNKPPKYKQAAQEFSDFCLMFKVRPALPLLCLTSPLGVHARR